MPRRVAARVTFQPLLSRDSITRRRFSGSLMRELESCIKRLILFGELDIETDGSHPSEPARLWRSLVLLFDTITVVTLFGPLGPAIVLVIVLLSDVLLYVYTAGDSGPTSLPESSVIGDN